jgi:hypothetical protein
MNTVKESIPSKAQPIIPAERILYDTIQEYLRHFWLYFIIAVIVSIPMNVLKIWSDPKTNPWSIAIISFILMMLFSDYSMLVMFLITQELQSKRTIDFRNTFLISIKKYFPLVWTMIMVMIAFMAGAIFCCIPGLIAGVFLCMAGGVVVWEHKNGFPALKRSFELTKPYFWRVLWTLILFYLVFFMLLTLLCGFPGLFIPSAPNVFKHIFNFQYKEITPPWWYTIYQDVIGMLLHPTSAIMTYILYRNLITANDLVIEPSPNSPTPENQ